MRGSPNTGETAAPRPLTRRADTLLEETLYEEQLLPVCSPALLAARRLYSMVVQAAVHGIGAAVGRPMLIARELATRTLVPLFARQAEAPERCCLITTAAARQRPEVQAFRAWVVREAAQAGHAAADAGPR